MSIRSLTLFPVLFLFFLNLTFVSAQKQDATSQEPTLTETVDWLKDKISSNGFYDFLVASSPGLPHGGRTTYKVDSIEFKGCSLEISATSMSSYLDGTIISKYLLKSRADMTVLDPAKVTVQQQFKGRESEMKGRVYMVFADTLSGQKKVQNNNMYQMRSIPATIDNKPTARLEIGFGDEEMANRVAKALTHAITMCESKKEPF